MIQLDKGYFSELDKGKIQNLLALAEPYFAHRKDMYRRYLRKDNANDIMSNEQNKTVIAFEYYIVNMAQGYLSGKAPTYTVKEGKLSEEYQKAIDYIRRYNDDAATFTELMHDYLITAAAYLYITENENNEIVYTRLDSRNTICVYDYGTPPYPIALLKVWAEKTDSKEIKKIEIITDKLRRIYNENGENIPFSDYGENGILQEMNEKPLFWNDVPAVPFENPDSITVFEPAIESIKAYENLITNVRNMTQYNDMAKLKIAGYGSENELYIRTENDDGSITEQINPKRIEEEKRLYEAATLFLQSDGDISWLLKTVDYNGILSVLKQLHDLITMLTGVPNMTDEAFSNANNASALGYKLYALDQYSATADRIFRKGYLRLWEIVTNRLNLKGKNYDFRDIDIIFNRNVPTDKDKSIQRAVTAKNAGLTSLETAITISGIEIDAESEMARINAEQLNDYEKIQKRMIKKPKVGDDGDI